MHNDDMHNDDMHAWWCIICMIICITACPHFDDYIKCKGPSQIMVCDGKFTNTGIFMVYRKMNGLEVFCCFVLPFLNVC